MFSGPQSKEQRDLLQRLTARRDSGRKNTAVGTHTYTYTHIHTHGERERERERERKTETMCGCVCVDVYACVIAIFAVNRFERGALLTPSPFSSPLGEGSVGSAPNPTFLVTPFV